MQELECHWLWAYLHVLLDDIVTIHLDMVDDVVVAVAGLVALGMSKYDDIEWLELVGTLWRKCNNDYVVLERCLTECIWLVWIVAIKKENNGRISHFVAVGKRYEHLQEPRCANLIVGPTVGGGCNRCDLVGQVGERGDGSTWEDEQRGNRQSRGWNALDDSHEL
jgi:hypothetical protein